MTTNVKSSFLPLLLITHLIIAASGCSYLQGDSVEPPAQTKEVLSTAPANETKQESRPSTSVAVQELAASKKEITNVEVIWAVPKEGVDSYVIRYGYDRDRLDHQVLLHSTALTQEKHPQHGNVYRHVIENVSARRPVFVSMWSLKDGESSQATAVIEASGNK